MTRSSTIDVLPAAAVGFRLERIAGSLDPQTVEVYKVHELEKALRGLLEYAEEYPRYNWVLYKVYEVPIRSTYVVEGVKQ